MGQYSEGTGPNQGLNLQIDLVNCYYSISLLVTKFVVIIYWSVYSIRLAQDMDQWWALVNTVMNLWVPYNAENFLTS
jgi:hypothetical protein